MDNFWPVISVPSIFLQKVLTYKYNIILILVNQMIMARPGQPAITSYMNGSTNGTKEGGAAPAVNGKPVESDKPVDEESKKGRFAWFEIEKTYLPYIFR